MEYVESKCFQNIQFVSTIYTEYELYDIIVHKFGGLHKNMDNIVKINSVNFSEIIMEDRLPLLDFRE